ncbi:unnamed protein product [Lactuca virosa]|uniref:Uncharacterized protein n=1 Tax=Lactuca virosa TaxID=75947 RepID=A0AAU9N6T9_9ASTR|nr:unnamed protein product [Lactuca virosa]
MMEKTTKFSRFNIKDQSLGRWNSQFHGGIIAPRPILVISFLDYELKLTFFAMEILKQRSCFLQLVLVSHNLGSFLCKKFWALKMGRSKD